MFTEKALAALKHLSADFTFACEPVIDIDPYLNVTYCFATAGAEKFPLHLSEFPSEKPLSKHFRKKFAAYLRTGTRAECLNCSYSKDRTCAGGCLALSIPSFQYGTEK